MFYDLHARLEIDPRYGVDVTNMDFHLVPTDLPFVRQLTKEFEQIFQLISRLNYNKQQMTNQNTNI